VLQGTVTFGDTFSGGKPRLLRRKNGTSAPLFSIQLLRSLENVNAPWVRQESDFAGVNHNGSG